MSNEKEIEPGSVIVVYWRDSCMYMDQNPINHDFKVSLMKTVGFLVRKTHGFWIIAREYVDAESVRGVITIPCENVTSVGICYEQHE